MKSRRTGVAAAAISMLVALPAGLRIAQAQTEIPSERPGRSFDVGVPFYDGSIVSIKEALQLNAGQLVLWAPVEAQLRTAFAARKKIGSGGLHLFYVFLDEKQKDVASVLLRPAVDGPWPNAGYSMREVPDRLGYYRLLMHGTILRGAQRIRDERNRPVDDTVPTTYYYPGGPMGKTIAKRREVLSARGEKGRYGIVGLWTGSMACHKQEGETWKFFESDPAAVKIARDPKNFTFISKCQPDIDITVGEPRLTLAKEADTSFDLLVIDTLYTADGIQAHMLTKEAVELYLGKLKADGVVLLHTSSRHVDLSSVLGANLKLLPDGTAGILATDQPRPNPGYYASTGTENVIVAKSARELEPYRLALAGGVGELESNGLHAWTDDNADVWMAMRRRK
jgi:hypothetical protein